MKTTMDLPDDLYRRVKAKAALEGKAVREVTMELYKKWLTDQPDTEDGQGDWLKSWLEEADAYIGEAPAGPTAREILEQDRNRAEKR